MSEPDQRVDCAEHGPTAATFACVHLRDGVACGFHADADEPGDPWPDAWCDACAATLARDGAWTEENEPEITLLCTGCYEVARRRNAALPAPLVPGAVALDAAAFAALAEAASARVQAVQEEAARTWGFLAKERWHYDRPSRTLRFFDEGGGPAVLARATAIGSFSTRTGTWLWTWANEAYPAEVRAASDPVRVFGEVRGFSRLAEPHHAVAEDEASELAQIAADLLGAAAVYRAPFEHQRVFFLLDDLRVAPA